MDMITQRSTYEQCLKIIDRAVAEALEDSRAGGMDVNEGDIWTDIAESYLLDANRDVAREIFRCQIGFVPSLIQRIWKQQDEAREIARTKRYAEKAAARAQARRDADEADRRLAAQKIKDARCPRCFTVRTPSGACNC